MTIVDHKKSILTSDLDTLENSLGFKLPNQYRSFLLKHNGGRPVPNRFYLRKFDHRDEMEQDPNNFITVDEFCDIDQLVEAWGYTQSIFEEYKVLPIADVAGGMIICVGYGPKNTDQIYYWHMEFDFIALTDSIDDFLNLFEEDIDS